MIPKVKFVLPDAEYEAKILNSFARDDGWGWGAVLYKHNPGLKEALVGAKTRQDRLKAIKEKYLKKALKEKKARLTKIAKLFQADWDEINDDFMKATATIMEEKWWLKMIKARVSLCTVNPRFIEDSSMGIFYKHSPDSLLRPVAHECVHFLYFRKFKAVFPDISEKTYNGRMSLVWALSEILAPVILEQPELRKFFDKDATRYAQFEKFKLSNGRFMIKHFERLFNNNRKKGMSFTDNLKICYAEAQKFRKDIMKAAKG